MKIEINYDLMEKIAEAKVGYSLKMHVKKVGILSFITTATFLTVDCIAGNDFIHTLSWITYSTCYYTLQSVLQATLLKNTTKKEAEKNLASLVSKLRTSNIKTDASTILDSYKYDTQYNVLDDEGAFPKFKENKYIKIPTCDEYWGNREMPIVQEHIIGTNNYFLSVGQPERKVYKLGAKTMLNK